MTENRKEDFKCAYCENLIEIPKHKRRFRCKECRGLHFINDAGEVKSMNNRMLDI
ncbi:putative DNA gyrase inhibitor [Vibrio phage PS15B.2]|nr:putative DNA gyrase inhibitor [Vibrio phage PS15B.2]QZI90862.1 putative DNA gyrase inhibitor [Vibrio phage PS15B.4]